MDSKNELQQLGRVLLQVKTSRSEEETPEAMVQLLANLTSLKKRFLYFVKRGIPVSLEIAVLNQTITFYISCPIEFQAFIEAQLVSQYPKGIIARVYDYVPEVLARRSSLALGQLKLDQGYVYPLRTFRDFKDIDPMSSMLGVLSKTQTDDRIGIQFLLVPISSSWQKAGKSQASAKQTSADGTATANPYAKVIEEKVAVHGFKTAIRIIANSESRARSSHLLMTIAGSFSSFNNPSGNSLVLRKPYLWQKDRLIQMYKERGKRFMPSNQILNIHEIASMFHFPTKQLSTINNIAWSKTILSEPPESLPVAEAVTEEEKENINFFARTEFKNKLTNFGIKKVDRRRHFYVIGKSGTGKSTFIANMAIDDLRKRRGFCVIDPHGDLCEHILNYVPSYRVNDIAYMNPADNERAFALNPLEVNDESQKELVASGIVAIFKKLYGESWGPRLEYILRNTIVSVIEMPNATLLMVPEMLANASFHAKVVERVTDPVLKSFWINEYDKMTDKLRVESISPIQNKVGQFTSSKRIRNIIDHPKSSIDIAKMMNEGKVLILNLSQGYLGEDNAALLGAMIITKIQLAAMNRVSIPEEQRRDFYLYVDEFQNFATSSFIKILSEARKFRLNLILANQYMAQVPEDVRAAIFGNAGTLMSFLIGASDAAYMAKEFGERFKDEDLLALGNHQAILKLCVDGITQAPFLCYTLPLPRSATQNKDKALRVSTERYTKPVE